MVYQKIGGTKATGGIGHWSPDRPKTVKPVITGAKTIKGQIFYVDELGKRYGVGAFDAMFGEPPVKEEMKTRKAKG